MIRWVRRDARTGARGQAVVELTLVIPVFLMILLGTMEYGSAIDHRTAMAYAVREGARVGASLGKGGSTPSAVDPAIVMAVQRGLTDPILMDNITSIVIFKADSAGRPVAGKTNTYDRSGNLIGTAGWPASTRVTGVGGVVKREQYMRWTQVLALGRRPRLRPPLPAARPRRRRRAHRTRAAPRTQHRPRPA